MNKIIIALMMGFSALAHSEDNKYLCISDVATGFAYVNKEWKSGNFKVKDDRYILRKFTKEENDEPLLGLFREGYRYGLFSFGADIEDYLCNFSLIDGKGRYSCGGSKGEFEMSLDSMLFIKTNTYGFHGEKSNSSTPHISIGRCTKI